MKVKAVDSSPTLALTSRLERVHWEQHTRQASARKSTLNSGGFFVWRHPIQIRDERLFGILSVLQFLLKQVAPTSRWKQRLKSLFAEYPKIPTGEMGFPSDWTRSPIWQ